MILDDIVIYTKNRIDKLKKEKSMDVIVKEALMLKGESDFSFEKALSRSGMSFICEIKKASPSKGIISEEFDYMRIAAEYEEAGAAAISVLTEPGFFLGKDEYLKEISETTKLPILRKDFVIDSYQIYEAKLLGAAAILLICSLLEEKELREYIMIANKLGMSVLVEAHTVEEIIKAILAGARIIGVNNRNLRTFEEDISNSLKLRNFVPDNIIFVSESSIKTREDIEELEKVNVDAVLIGETMMCSDDKGQKLAELRGDCID